MDTRKEANPPKNDKPIVIVPGTLTHASLNDVYIIGRSILYREL